MTRGLKLLAGSLVGLAILGSACGGAELGQGTQELEQAPLSGDVQVSLEMTQASLGATDDVEVKVTFTNHGSKPVQLLDWNLPGEGVRGDMFVVLRDGAPVEYQGAHIKYPAPQASDYVTLAPGKSLTRAMSITDMYDFSQSGSYTLRYEPGASGEASIESNGLRSNDVSVSIAGRANPRVVPSDDFSIASLSYASCSTTRQSTVSSAFNSARTYATNSYNYLVNTTPSGTPRYTTWFGAYSSTRWGTVRTHFSSIKNAFDTKAVVVDCSCTSSYYAYVYKNSPYRIYVCNAFWNAPMTGTDSKAGTLVHEMSHFTVVADTDDWAYGHSACKSLAISNPTNAVDNADSHEYFAENTPAQN